jgi:ArsR family transcriptional regulator, arsenate/arsenite/antimonite-responsive transcriptional repressor
MLPRYIDVLASSRGRDPVQLPTVTQDAAPVCCPPLDAVLDEGDALQVATVFKALSHPARVQIVNLLARSDGGELCVCDFTEAIGLAQPTVSHHLKLLREAGLIAGDRRGTWVYYHLVPDTVASIRQALTI